jgi:hypothetical protein
LEPLNKPDSVGTPSRGHKIKAELDSFQNQEERSSTKLFFNCYLFSHAKCINQSVSLYFC